MMLLQRLKNNSLLLVVVGVFVVSAVFSLAYQIRPTVDAKAYDKIAWNLAQGHGYIENIRNVLMPELDDAIVRVGPGYEFFLAGIYKLFGHQLWMVWILQAFLRAATAFLLYEIAVFLFCCSAADSVSPTDRHNLLGNHVSDRHTNASRIGLAAAMLFGVTPDLIVMNGMLLAETLFIGMFVFSIHVSLNVLRLMRYHSLALASFAWGMTSLIRPTALVVFLAYAIALMLQQGWKWKQMSILFLFPLLFVGGWSVRNSFLYKQPLFTTTAGSLALYVGNHLNASGGYDKPPDIQRVRDRHHSVELSSIALEKVIEFGLAHPVQFLTLQIKKTIIYFSLARPTGFWFYLSEHPFQQILTLFLSATATAILFVAGSAGLYDYARKEKSLPARFIIATIVLQPFVVIPTYVETRYRYPLFPLLAVFTVYVILAVWKARKAQNRLEVQRFWNILGIAAGVIICVTVIDVTYSYDLILERGRHILNAIL